MRTRIVILVLSGVIAVTVIGILLFVSGKTTLLFPAPVSQSNNPATTTSATPGSILYDVAYGPLPAETADVCLPASTSASLPAVILIHGGSWIHGDKSEWLDTCQEVAAKGMVGVTISYRLTATTTGNAKINTWPDQLVDAQLAMRWLRTNAGTYHVNTHEICSWGSSAGGHLAVFLGVLATIHSGDEAGLYANESPQADCVVDDFGPVLLTGLSQKLATNFIPVGSDTAAVETDASPITLVSSKSAPMLIVQGTEDTTVPPSQSQNLYQDLLKNGVPAQYVSYPGEHAFKGISQSDHDTITSQSIAYIASRF